MSKQYIKGEKSHEELIVTAIARSLKSDYQLGEYMKTSDDCIKYIKQNGFKNFLLRCFEWEKTEEGHTYWYSLYNEVRKDERRR